MHRSWHAPSDPRPVDVDRLMRRGRQLRSEHVARLLRRLGRWLRRQLVLSRPRLGRSAARS